MKVIQPTGDYGVRRDAAKAAGARLHIQFHVNSGGGRYALTEITEGAADSRATGLAKQLARDFQDIFAQNSSQVRTLSRGDRGWVCIGDEVPGIITEPCWADNRADCDKLRDPAVRERMAQDITKRIRALYHEDEVVCLTLGHKYKTSNPDDRGCDLVGGGTEADIMEYVYNRVAQLLREGERVIPHESDNQVLNVDLMRQDTFGASGFDPFLHEHGIAHAHPETVKASELAKLTAAARSKLIGDAANVANAFVRNNWKRYL